MHEQALIFGWQTENLSRAGKSFQDLSHYLKMLQPANERADEGARALREMIQRRLQKQRTQ